MSVSYYLRNPRFSSSSSLFLPCQSILAARIATARSLVAHAIHVLRFAALSNVPCLPEHQTASLYVFSRSRFFNFRCFQSTFRFRSIRLRFTIKDNQPNLLDCSDILFRLSFKRFFSSHTLFWTPLFKHLIHSIWLSSIFARLVTNRLFLVHTF
jgi:hypothetical protein